MGWTVTDIVDRLRICAGGPGDAHTVVICRLTRVTARDAADEIERLRAECAVMKLEIDAATRAGFKKAAKVAERAGIKAPAATAFDAAAAIRALLTGGKR